MITIDFYQTVSGNSPVEEFLDDLNSEQAKKVLWVMQLIEELQMPPKQYFKKLKNTDDIWEIRVIYAGSIFRVLGFFLDHSVFIATNGFQKKTQKTPASEILRSTRYKRDYLRRQTK